jgi:hypothetical protein
MIVNRHHQYFQDRIGAIRPPSVNFDRSLAEQQHLAVGFLYFAAILRSKHLIPIAPGKRASAHAWDWSARGYAPPATLTILENHDKVITMTFPKELLDRLGLAESATEIEVYAALDARLAAQAAPAQPDASSAIPNESRMASAGMVERL